MNIYTTKHFEKTLNKLTKKNSLLLQEVKIALTILQDNQDNPKLKLHKLESRSTQDWSISVNQKIRIIFYYKNEKLILTNIGTHDDVY
jgi:mRNA-degrading endonuclease YafQ of YafQ-DinJ toxin-antitoxin module